MQMQAAILRATNAPFEVVTLDLELPRASEVLVRIAAVGVCHSDWHLRTGATVHALPVVAGHEACGRVTAVGEAVRRVKPSDQVVLNWTPSCGGCFYCLNAQPHLCGSYAEQLAAGTMMDGTTRLSHQGLPVRQYCSIGGFAEYAIVPEESCVALHEEIPAPIGAILGCAVTTGIGAVIHTAGVTAGSSVAVFGAGGVGLSTISGARLVGAQRIIAIDRFTSKFELAFAVGATDAFPADTECIARIREVTEGRGADYVFETTGVPGVQERCLAAARRGGVVVFAGLSPMDSRINLPGSVLVRQEKTVKGSYYGSAYAPRDMLTYADLYRHGRLPLDKLVSRTYRLDQINEAFADMLHGAVARGVIIFPMD